jgi:hypothetical protein
MHRPTVWNCDGSTFYKSWNTTLYYKNEAYVCGFVGMEVNKKRAVEVWHRRPDLDIGNVDTPVLTAQETVDNPKKAAVKKGVGKPKKAAVKKAAVKKAAMKSPDVKTVVKKAAVKKAAVMKSPDMKTVVKKGVGKPKKAAVKKGVGKPKKAAVKKAAVKKATMKSPDVKTVVKKPARTSAVKR